MDNDFKPDLGLHLLKQYGNKVVHHYYDVPVTRIDHVGDELYSIPIVMTLEQEYFASFDFPIEIQTHIYKETYHQFKSNI